MSREERVTSDEDLGRAIRRRREAQRISQDRLAGLADVARTTVVNVEAGRGARPSSLRRIAAALDTTTEALTGESREPATPAEEDPSKRWNLLERAQMLREMAAEYERQANEQEGRDRPA